MRSLTTRAKPFVKQLRSIVPSISFINHDDSKSKSLLHLDEKFSSFLQCRSYGVYGNSNNNNTVLGLGLGCGVNFGDPKRSAYRCCDVPMTTTSGFLLARNMSSTNKGYGSEKIHDMASDKTNGSMTDHTGDNSFVEMSKLMSETPTDTTFVDETVEFVSNQASAFSEVVAAAADSFLPVAAMQYAFYGIHIFTGLNWWASITITSVILKALILPLWIKHQRATIEKHIKRLKIEETKKELHHQGKSPTEVEEIIKSQYGAYGNSGLVSNINWNALFIHAPIFGSAMCAIMNMVEKVPSFTTGGLSWFLDLTTPDPFFILPCLHAYSLWLFAKAIIPPGLDDNHVFRRVGAIYSALLVILLAGYPKAYFFFLIADNLVAFVYALILKDPKMKKLLKIPHIDYRPQA